MSVVQSSPTTIELIELLKAVFWQEFKDLWVIYHANPSQENDERLKAACEQYGKPSLCTNTRDFSKTIACLSTNSTLRLVDRLDDKVRSGEMTVQQFESFLQQYDLVPSDDDSQSDLKLVDDLITVSDW